MGLIHTMLKMRMKETSRLHKATTIGINRGNAPKDFLLEFGASTPATLDAF